MNQDTQSHYYQFYFREFGYVEGLRLSALDVVNDIVESTKRELLHHVLWPASAELHAIRFHKARAFKGGI